jgi:hypothetical protein
MKKGNGKPGQKFSLERLEKLCEKYGIDPAEVAVEGLDRELTPDLKDKERIDIALRLMEYTYAKRKAVEISGEDGGPVELIVKWVSEKSSK